MLAKGSTRLQLDCADSSDLDFNMFSSKLLAFAKPEEVIHTKALKLVGVKPKQMLDDCCACI